MAGSWMGVWLAGVALLTGAGAQATGTGAAASAGRASCAVRHGSPTEAEKALGKREYAKALGLYQAMASAPGEQETGQAGMVRVQLEQNNLAAARSSAEAMVSAHPQSGLAAETLAEVLLREGRIPEARNEVVVSAKLDPCLPRDYLVLAATDDLSGLFATARKHLALARKLDGVDPEIERYARVRLEPAEKAAGGSCHVSTPLETATIPLRASVSYGGAAATYNMVEVELNGHKTRMQLDSGASGLFITAAQAKAAGLVTEGSVKFGGVGDKGAQEATLARVPSIKIGPVEFADCLISVGKEAGPEARTFSLIGSDVFRDWLIAIDFPAAKIKLDPLPALPAGVAEAPAPFAASLDLSGREMGMDAGAPDRYVAPEMRDWTSFYRSGHEIFLPTQIRGGTSRLFLVDTGAASMLISPVAAKEITKVRGDANMQIFGVSGAVKDVRQTSTFEMAFAGLRQSVDSMTSIDTTDLSHGAGVEVSGFLGATVLFKTVVHLDYRDNLIFLELLSHKPVGR